MMELEEVRVLLKMHTYYLSCSYEVAWCQHIHPDIKKIYSFEEVMKNI